MKLGVFAVLFGGKPFEETLDYIKELGLEAVEIGTGAYPGDAHCKPAELLKNDKKLKAFKEAIDRRGLTISALSCHGNPLHPDEAFARRICACRCYLCRSSSRENGCRRIFHSVERSRDR